MAAKDTKGKGRSTRRPGGGRPTGGSRRVTPKGGRVAATAQRSHGTTHPDESTGRYTPPTPQSYYESPQWVPILMFGLFIVGILVIVANYVHLLPGGESGWYLLVGVAFITAGIFAATQYR